MDMVSMSFLWRCAMQVYKFELYDLLTEKLVMGTELDEPNPMVDAEFWTRFMQGDVVMVHAGIYNEGV
jgi:hypothetical protein